MVPVLNSAAELMPLPWLSPRSLNLDCAELTLLLLLRRGRERTVEVVVCKLRGS
jgi:hypothetical protein